jgi:hypothetical protein
LTAPTSDQPSFAVSDGAHAGNPAFFWQPPLAPDASSDPNWTDGGFNPNLLVNVDVCELDRNPLDFPPTHATPATCISTASPVAHFGPGQISVSAVDEQYQVNWKTEGLTSNASGFYRLYVYVGTLETPGPVLGFIDLDPVDKGMKKLQTEEIVPFQEGRTIPVKFRIERGVLCPEQDTGCFEQTITKGDPGEVEIVQYTEEVNGIAVPLAGVAVPTEAFPEGVETLTFRLRKVATSDGGGGVPPVLCHPNLPLQQFDGCFEITTVPELPFIGESSNQFPAAITVAVCFELHDTGDPREPFVQLWATDDGVSRALPSASDEGILTDHDAQDCGDAFALASSNPLVRFASSGLRALGRGFDAMFGVKTAYAVDRGLGGLTQALSTISPVLTAEIEAVSETELTLPVGVGTTATVRIVGTTHHDPDPELGDGIPTIPVTFSLAAGNGTLFEPGTEGEIEGQVLTLQTNIADEETDPGFASIEWVPPETPGTYTMTATGPAQGGPVTFTIIVEAPEPFGEFALGRLSMQTGSTFPIPDPDLGPVTWTSSNAANAVVSAAGVVTAVVGGENINAAAEAVITATEIGGTESVSALVNSFHFNTFPRTTTLAWNAVDGAVAYQVIVEHGNGVQADCGGLPAACTTWTGGVIATTQSLTHTFDFVGKQPGRWRINALGLEGEILGTSANVYFNYDI